MNKTLDALQPQEILSFEDYAKRMNLSQERLKWAKEMFAASPNIKSLIMESRRGDVRVLRPKDI